MPSTYIDFQVFSRDLARTLKRVGQEPQVAREAEYYRNNIGKVKSVDDFLADRRLYEYAMKAHGMSDMIYAKAFMRKVLESDLSDTRSFARSLVDSRYQVFARAFQFTTEGKVSEGIEIAQTVSQEDATVGLYSEYRDRRGAAVAAEVENFQDRIGLMTSVDDLLRDDRLLSFALTSFGFDPKHASMTTIRNVLTSDLSDPTSVANTLGDSRYVDLAKAFNFATDGSVPSGSSAQSAAQTQDLIYRNYEITGNGASPAAAAFKTEVYEAGIAAIGTVDDLLADDKLYNFALAAFGINPTLETKAGIRLVLLSDLSDPQSIANQLPAKYQSLAAAFNFNADGTVAAGGAQSATQLEDTVDGYLTHYDDAAESSDASLSAYFRSKITSITSVDALLADSRLYSYVLGAFDFDPAAISKTEIRRILESDSTDPKSYANSRSDPRYRALAAAFNFASDGSVTTPLKAMGDADELAIVRLYSSRIGTSETEKANAKTETTYFHDAIGKVATVDEVLADKRLVDYVVKAFDLEDAGLNKDALRRLLTSDPLDPKSYANSFGDKRYRDLAGAFNFTAEGKIARAPQVEVQTRNDLLATTDLYLRQAMETEAGAQNEGVRLALYFQRKAPEIVSAYSILADKALIEVVRTALGLPESMSQIDIDAQAKIISKRLDVEDLQDPAKLEKFLAKFSALYDMNNNTSAASSAASILFGGSESGVNDNLLATLQNIRFSRI
jgi:hypothetical protein